MNRIFKFYNVLWDERGTMWDSKKPANPHEYYGVGLWDMWDSIYTPII